MIAVCLAGLLAVAPIASDPAPAAPPAPGPMTTVQPSVAPAAAPAPEPVPLGPRAARLAEIQRDPELRRQHKRAETMIIGGAVVGGLGVATLLLVALPARNLYLRSLEQAEEARWVTDVEEPAERARARERVMWTSAAVGGGVAALGGVLLTAGLVRRYRLRQPAASTFSVAPAVGGGQLGMSASVQF